MRIVFPRADLPIVDGGEKPVDRNWLKWFRQVWESLGWSPSVPVFTDLYCGADQMVASGGTTTNTAIDGDLTTPQMRAGNDDSRIGTLRLPNNYREGTAVKPFVDWLPTTTGAGDVRLELSYGTGADGDTITETVEAIDATTPEVADQVVTTEFTEISGTDLTKGAVVKLRVMREGTHANDTYGDTAGLLGVGLKYQAEGIGWETVHP